MNLSKEKFDFHKIFPLHKEADFAVEKHEKIDLEKQWRIAFVTMVLLGISFIAFEVYLFMQIDKNNIFTSVAHETVQVETLNLSEIERTIDHYKEKNSIFESLLSSGNRLREGSPGALNSPPDENFPESNSQ